MVQPQLGHEVVNQTPIHLFPSSPLSREADKESEIELENTLVHQLLGTCATKKSSDTTRRKSPRVNLECFFYYGYDSRRRLV